MPDKSLILKGLAIKIRVLFYLKSQVKRIYRIFNGSLIFCRIIPQIDSGLSRSKLFP